MKAKISIEEIYALIKFEEMANGQELSEVIHSFENADLDKNHLILDFKAISAADIDDVLLENIGELIDIAQANNGHTVLTGTDEAVKSLLEAQFIESEELEYLPKVEEGIDAIFMADLLDSFDGQEDEA